MTRRRLAPLLLAAAACILPSCVTEGPPLPQPPREPPKQPAGVTPDAIVMNVDPVPEDADYNGFYDTLAVTIHLFNKHSPYALSLKAQGTMTFSLASLEGATLAEWSFPPEQMAPLIMETQPGPAYQFTLDINRVASDVVSVQDGVLTAAFQPAAGGPTITTHRGAMVRIGRVR